MNIKKRKTLSSFENTPANSMERELAEIFIASESQLRLRCDPADVRLYEALPVEHRYLFVAYHWQAKHLGDLDAISIAKLQRIDRDRRNRLALGQTAPKSVPPIPPMRRAPEPTTSKTLQRTYRGEVHTVIVEGDCFIWRGNVFGSLSEIARRITGTRWSGPRFFGITAKAPRQTKT